MMMIAVLAFTLHSFPTHFLFSSVCLTRLFISPSLASSLTLSLLLNPRQMRSLFDKKDCCVTPYMKSAFSLRFTQSSLPLHLTYPFIWGRLSLCTFYSLSEI